MQDWHAHEARTIDEPRHGVGDDGNEGQRVELAQAVHGLDGQHGTHRGQEPACARGRLAAQRRMRRWPGRALRVRARCAGARAGAAQRAQRRLPAGACPRAQLCARQAACTSSMLWWGPCSTAHAHDERQQAAKRGHDVLEEHLPPRRLWLSWLCPMRLLQAPQHGQGQCWQAHHGAQRRGRHGPGRECPPRLKGAPPAQRLVAVRACEERVS